MATLKALQVNIEAGHIVADRSRDGDEYTVAYKEDGQYIYFHEFTFEQFDTFEQLYARAEEDAQFFTEQELDHWDIESERPEEETAYWQPIIDAILAAEKEPAQAIFKEALTKRAQAQLFQLARTNPSMKGYAKAAIARLHNTI